MYSSNQMALILKIDVKTVIERLKREGMFQRKADRYDQNALEAISYKRYRDKKKPFVTTNEMKIAIIEAFLREKDNSSRRISELLGLTIHSVSVTISEYLENKCLILKSKL
jgi:hypothetical protein